MKEKHGEFLFPYQSENVEKVREFPSQGKTRKISRISQGRKTLYIINIYQGIFPDGQRGKERRA